MSKNFGVSPLTNTIYYGTMNKDKSTFVGDKEDVTNDVLRVVFEWFMGNMDNVSEYAITFPSTNFELVMRKK